MNRDAGMGRPCRIPSFIYDKLISNITSLVESMKSSKLRFCHENKMMRYHITSNLSIPQCNEMHVINRDEKWVTMIC